MSIKTFSIYNKISLKELFDNYNEENFINDFLWDESIGIEIW